MAQQDTGSDPAGGRLPTVDELLGASDWEARLAEARRRRAAVLGGRAPKRPLPAVKPWDRPDYLRTLPAEEEPEPEDAAPGDADEAIRADAAPAPVWATAGAISAPAPAADASGPAATFSRRPGRLPRRIAAAAAMLAAGVSAAAVLQPGTSSSPDAAAVARPVRMAAVAPAAPVWPSGTAPVRPDLPGAAPGGPVRAALPQLDRPVPTPLAMETPAPLARVRVALPDGGAAPLPPAAPREVALAALPAPTPPPAFTARPVLVRPGPGPVPPRAVAGLPPPVVVAQPRRPAAAQARQTPPPLRPEHMAPGPRAAQPVAALPEPTAMAGGLPKLWVGTGRIALFLPDGEAETILRAVRDTMRAEGFASTRVGRVGFRVTGTQVRYFSPAYAGEARRIARLIEGEVRDFTGFSPKPPRGTIEVWLSGQPRPRPPAPPAPAPVLVTRDGLILIGPVPRQRAGADAWPRAGGGRDAGTRSAPDRQDRPDPVTLADPAPAPGPAAPEGGGTSTPASPAAGSGDPAPGAGAGDGEPGAGRGKDRDGDRGHGRGEGRDKARDSDRDKGRGDGRGRDRDGDRGKDREDRGRDREDRGKDREDRGRDRDDRDGDRDDGDDD